ncbi:hypothetical protein O3M35_001598 [Rhynocoris fuscipes]|uniref:F-box domain-containing protein n=1 Tax=Rhynocoris fuscipes TaxID=488301 RepID=A0AAW1CP15_9HEMI
MSESGSYVLNEYFIVKLIFSYLPSKDLISASKVCRNWKDIASRLLSEYADIQSYVFNNNEIVPSFNDKLSPNIILDFSGYRSSISNSKTGKRLLDLLHETYYLDDALIYNIQADHNIFSWEFGEKSVIGLRNCPRKDPSHLLMLFGDLPGVNIDCFQEFEKRIVKADGSLANLEEISKSKGIILFSGPRSSSSDQAQLFVDEVIEICQSRKQFNFKLAGGISRNILRIESTNRKTELLGVTFNGENIVSVDADVHISNSVVLEDFMKSFSKRVGELPEGCIRIAFAFICINRYNSHRDLNLFKKSFPGIPIYGFYSYGEYYLNGIPDGSKKMKCEFGSAGFDNERFLYTDSSSFLIVTYKKAKATFS